VRKCRRRSYACIRAFAAAGAMVLWALMASGCNNQSQGAPTNNHSQGASIPDEIPGVIAPGTPPPRPTGGTVSPETSQAEWQAYLKIAIEYEELVLPSSQLSVQDIARRRAYLDSLSNASINDLRGLMTYQWISEEASAEYRLATQSAQGG
jgi:hypothetical protein